MLEEKRIEGNVERLWKNQYKRRYDFLKIEGNVEIDEANQEMAEGCSLVADGDIKINGDNQFGAIQCLVVAGKKLSAKTHGRGSVGCVIIGEEIEGKISPNVLAIDRSYENFDELKEYFLKEHENLRMNPGLNFLGFLQLLTFLQFTK